MKSFKKYLREFTGDDLPPAGPRYKLFHHKVYQLTEFQNPDEDYDTQFHTHYDESEHVHDLGYVALPVDNADEANEILHKRYKDFHFATCLSHDHNYPDEPTFGFQPLSAESLKNAQSGGINFGDHLHGDGRHHEVTETKLGGFPDISHRYSHFIEPVEGQQETTH